MKEYIVSEDSYAYEMRRYDELEELIRCKDCKYHDYGRCVIWGYSKTEDDYFCKDGERKEEW